MTGDLTGMVASDPTRGILTCVIGSPEPETFLRLYRGMGEAYAPLEHLADVALPDVQGGESLTVTYTDLVEHVHGVVPMIYAGVLIRGQEPIVPLLPVILKYSETK